MIGRVGRVASKAVALFFTGFSILLAIVIALLLVAILSLSLARAEPAAGPSFLPRPIELGGPAKPLDELEAELAEGEDEDQAVLDVDRGIRYVLQASPCWGIAANAETRRDMAEMIAEASEAAQVPPLLLTVLAKRESSFSKDAVGSRGEVGILQVHGLAARGCDLSTAEGQLACGAKWLRKAFDMCGTWERAITAYAAGYCTAPRKSKLATLVLSRFRQWQRAQAIIDSCHDINSRHWVCKPRPWTCNEAIRVIARERDRPYGKGFGLSSLQVP
jgi:hypothetical protein